MITIEFEPTRVDETIRLKNLPCSEVQGPVVRSPFSLNGVDRVLSPDIVQFRSACLRTEIFLGELTLSSTLSSNPKSSHFVDPQFSHKLLFYLD